MLVFLFDATQVRKKHDTPQRVSTFIQQLFGHGPVFESSLNEQKISFVPAQRRRGRRVSQRTSFSKREAYACNIYTSHFAAPNGAAVWLATTILPRWGKHTKWLYIDFNLMLLNHYSVRVQSQAGLRTNRRTRIFPWQPTQPMHDRIN